ncbi:MAG: RidA family protein [Chloroflexota bacterium]
MERRVINPWTWQDALGFVQANEVTGAQKMLICSGQTSVDENGAPMHAGDMSAQFNKAIDNLETVLKAAGMSLGNVVKITVYTTDVDAFIGAAMANQARMAEVKFASTLVGVTRLAFPPLMVELEATAVA